VNFREQLQDPRARMERCVLCVDLVAFQSLKESYAESSWISEIGLFLDIATRAVHENGGTLQKLLGDGIIASFQPDNASGAINAAISIQEKVRSQRTEARGNLQCAIGIATGKVTTFSNPDADTEEIIGEIVDRAMRLCGIASAGAILVDSSTVASANLGTVHSAHGEMIHRSGTDYLSTPQLAPLKGFTRLVSYHEVLWDERMYGVRPSVLTEAAKAAERPSAPVDAAGQPGPSPEKYISGHVQRWYTERGNGFILSDAKGFFYFDSRFAVDLAGVEVWPGARVFFVARSPLIRGRNPVAACVVFSGQRVRGRVTYVRTDRRDGFVLIQDPSGNSQSLFSYLGDDAERFSAGQAVELQVQETDRGLTAIEVRAVLEDPNVAKDPHP
jgi:class 3 adenylate cyclase/cold shock CspA family protein